MPDSRLRESTRRSRLSCHLRGRGRSPNVRGILRQVRTWYRFSTTGRRVTPCSAPLSNGRCSGWGVLIVKRARQKPTFANTKHCVEHTLHTETCGPVASWNGAVVVISVASDFPTTYTPDTPTSSISSLAADSWDSVRRIETMNSFEYDNSTPIVKRTRVWMDSKKLHDSSLFAQGFRVPSSPALRYEGPSFPSRNHSCHQLSGEG